MGTTLTGLTPATTYDALIKVGDNGPLSATAKYVGDGLGNDSVVALSTSSVGIGTTSPTQLLHVAGNVRITGALYDGNNAAGTSGQILSSTGTATDWIDVSSLGVVDGSGTANYVSKWSDPNTLTNSVIYDNGTNVGIGTSSPTALLDLYSAIGVQLRLANSTTGTADTDGTRIYLSGSDLFIVNRESASIQLYTADTERMRITADGNVKLGASTTGTPSANADDLVIDKGAAESGITIMSTAAATLRFGDAANTSIGSIEYDHSGDYMRFNTSGSEKVRITSAGNVGIGTSSPTEKLHIVSSSDVTVRLQRTGVRELNLSSSGITASSEFLYLSSDYGALSAIALTTNSVERVRIGATGNVGIGTTTPAAKLDVNGGNIHSFYTYSGGAANYNLRIGNDLSATEYGYFSQLGGSTFVANNNYYAFAGQFTPTATSASIISQSGGDISFFANTGLTAGVNYTPTERMKLDSSGNLSLPTGNIALSGAGGIYFDSGASKYLDDYEVGSFTPSVAFGGGSTGITYFDRVGNYTKIGRQVYVQMYVALTSKGSSTGTATITGLPFTVASANRGSVGTIALDFADITFTGQMSGQAGQSATEITLTNTTEAGARSVMTNANFTNASQFWLNIIYNA